MKLLQSVLAVSLMLFVGSTILAAEHGKNESDMSERKSEDNGKQNMKAPAAAREKQEKMRQSDDDNEMERERERDKKNSMEKQRENKMEQEQKELGKGSDQGQESREERRKWWRFWE